MPIPHPSLLSLMTNIDGKVPIRMGVFPQEEPQEHLVIGMMVLSEGNEKIH
jgi:hypothetical protein